MITLMIVTKNIQSLKKQLIQIEELLPGEALAKIASRAKFDDRKTDLPSSQNDISG
jgi:hypothetical protein